MRIHELFGLPAHPLLVHIPVVVLPMAFGVAVLAVWPRVRRPLAAVAALLAVVGAVGAYLADGAGRWLRSELPKSDLIEAHAHKGERVVQAAIVFAVVAVAGAVVAELSRRRGDRPAAPERAAPVPEPEPARSPGPGAAAAREAPSSSPAGVLASGVTVVLLASALVGAYTTYTVVEAGHSGSKAVYDGILPKDDGGNGGSNSGSGGSNSGSGSYSGNG